MRRTRTTRAVCGVRGARDVTREWTTSRRREVTIAHPHSRARAPTRTERASDNRDGVSRESSVRRVVFGADDARWRARGAGDDVVGVGENGIGNSPRRGRGTRDVDGSLLGAHDAAR